MSNNKSDQNHKINYIEFVSTDIQRSKRFYSAVFGWSFEDWGPDYISFTTPGAGIDGGFRSGEVLTGQTSSPLVVLYAAEGGTITVPTFDFPGGRRFHFADGAGNTLAVWSE
jgi:predicted enzyme related to lactoylglutathione lyase